MSTFRDRARDLIPIGIALAMIAVFALACRDHREPVTEEEKETWDATTLFLAGVFTDSSFDDRAVVAENFWANYDWIKEVFLLHVRGTPPHDWTECRDNCIPAVQNLTKGDDELEEEVRSALAQSPEKTESR